jgi:hypothetical protein
MENEIIIPKIMKTLIIHPEDKSTFFLDIVYNNIPNKTVITKGTIKEVNELIKTHDRVMMMGHGSPNGLFTVGKFEGMSNYVISRDTVELLREKTDNVFIWCNADQFVEEYDLKGFYSGMFISEVGEAYYCGIPRRHISQELVDESNYGFCNILGECINESTDTIYDKVKESYGLIAENNLIAYYNNERLYKF